MRILGIRIGQKTLEQRAKDRKLSFGIPLNGEFETLSLQGSAESLYEAEDRLLDMAGFYGARNIANITTTHNEVTNHKTGQRNWYYFVSAIGYKPSRPTQPAA